MPLSTYMGDVEWTVYLRVAQSIELPYRARMTAAEIGITAMHLHTMGPCVGFPISSFHSPTSKWKCKYCTLSIQTVRQVGGGALVDSPFDNEPALSTTRLMMSGTGNLCSFTVLAVATGTSCIYNLSKVVARGKLMSEANHDRYF